MTFQQGAQRAPISHPQVLEIGAICPSNHQFLLLSKRKRIIRFTIRGQIDPDKIIMVCGCALWARFTMGNIWPPGTKAYQYQGLLVWVPPSTIRGHLLVWVLKVLGSPIVPWHPITRTPATQGSGPTGTMVSQYQGLLDPGPPQGGGLLRWGLFRQGYLKYQSITSTNIRLWDSGLGCGKLWYTSDSLVTEEEEQDLSAIRI